MKKILAKLFNKETILYLVFGVLTTCVNYAVCFLFYRFTDISILIYNVVAWVAAVAFAYITNKLFVFESKSFRGTVVLKELVSFVSARLLSLGIEELFLFVSVEKLHANELIAKLIAQVFVVVFNYFASKLFIFRKKDEDNQQ